MVDKTAPNPLTAKLPGELNAYIFREDNTLRARMSPSMPSTGLIQKRNGSMIFIMSSR